MPLRNHRGERNMGGMVDISAKKDVLRIAVARGRIKLKRETILRIRDNRIEKGNVIEATKIVIMNAVKRTAQILPFCHPIEITHIDPKISISDDFVEVEVTVKSFAKTGVEMEALMGVSIGLLNIWDMVKKYEKDEVGQYPYTKISDIIVVKKQKGER